MNIAFDLDEVLADFLSGFIKFHNSVYRTQLKYEDFFSYRYWEVIGGTQEEAIGKVHEFHKTHFFLDIKPVSNAEKVIRELKQSGHELFIITSRQEIIGKETMDWINRYFANCFTKIYFTNNYAKEISTLKKKSDFCVQLQIDLIIEDSVEYAKECYSEKTKVLLLDKPWNKIVITPNIKRINSLLEIVQEIRK